MKNKENKPKKEKVIYYDDNRTIANMDNVKKSNSFLKGNNNIRNSSGNEKMKTFFQAFKMMLIPTGVVLLILLILYIIFMLIGSAAS